MNEIRGLTRAEALQAWRAFLPKTKAYAGMRNHVREGHGNVSRLSAAIRYRLLLEDEIIEETLAENALYAVEKWVQEVCWRRYWKGWLEMRPDVWKQWRRRVNALRETLPREVLVRAEAVEMGESGVACMDGIARELIETGYLHNHARMWWASFWIHVERLPWELGADVFFRHLLDADPASNTLSWRWVAGLQTAGKTYLVRLSNVEKYAPGYLAGNEAGSERLADGAVSAAWVAEFADTSRQPLAEYATSVGEVAGRVGLWLHPDDLAAEIGPVAGLAPVGVVACVSDRVYQDVYRLSEKRVASLRAVLKDGVRRASEHFGCGAVVSEADDPVKGLGEWAVGEGLDEVVALAPMVGPVGDMVPKLARHLESLGIRLRLVRRESDVKAFSFATAGFFPFWQKMSRHLKEGQLV